MRSYSIELPRGVIVDVFNLPKDFEEQIIESFKGYTEETAKEYTAVPLQNSCTDFAVVTH